MRAPTKEEKDAMSAQVKEVEAALMGNLKAWANAVYQVGFAAGVEKTLASVEEEDAEGGIVVPIRPKIVIP